MSKLKRLRRKRAEQKKVNIRQMGWHSPTGETVGSGKLLKRMTRDHQDLLQNIEFVLISGYRDNGTIDDRIVADALSAAIGGNVSQDRRAQSLTEALEGIREFRSDVSDEIWRDGLRTVLQSVRRHSSLRPGSRGYLDFVSDFIL
ncbi:MAG: hypothetical protein JSW66_12875 [Phycisphaerales bacterium]|nr:MAG: hypothetical protein JSW66_12875 [Phycisphaerales bacterium]